MPVSDFSNQVHTNTTTERYTFLLLFSATCFGRSFDRLQGEGTVT